MPMKLNSPLVCCPRRKHIYPDHRSPPWLIKDAPHESVLGLLILTVSVRSNLDLYRCDVGQNVVSEFGYKYNGLWLAVLVYQLAGVTGGR